MSWYNNTANDFQDATQLFLGGGGGGGTSITINEGDTTTIVNDGDNTNTGTDTTLSDIIDLRLDHNEDEYEDPNATQSYNLYVKNNNAQGEIRFFTIDAVNNNDVSNAALKYNVKIGTDGKIYGYYTYNPIISALTTSKWIDLIDDSVRARQAGDNALAAATTAGGVAGAAQLTASTALTNATTAAAAASAAASSAAAANASINSLVSTFEAFRWTRETLSETFEAIGQASFNTLRISIKTRADLAVTAMATAARAQVRLNIGAVSLTAFNLFSSIVGVYAGAGITAGIAAGFAYLFDYLRQENRRETLSQYLRLLEEDEKNGASLGTTQDVLILSGLQIVSATNSGFTSPGTYVVDIGNDVELEIVISTGLTATITKVVGGGDGYSTGSTISIPKSNLGGGSGDLDITIISVTSEKGFIENEIQEIGTQIVNTDNRIRRRQNIPNTSSFTNGFTITNTTITEPEFGETTNEPSISLKLDTSQFQYDSGGLLQVVNYNTIANSATDITNLNTDITDLETELANVTSLLMDEGLTYSTNTNYKLKLGYKNLFESQHYNLLTIALKQAPSGTLDPTLYGNDFIGYYPTMDRLSDDLTEIDYVDHLNVELLSTLQIKKGLLFFKNKNPVKNYDLNRKFELVIFLRPADIDHLDVRYHILQTGSVTNPDIYSVNPNKLNVFIKNNKLNVRHFIKNALYYYQSGTTNLFILYMLSTFATNGTFTTLLNYKSLQLAVNTSGDVNNMVYGIDNTQNNNPIPTDNQWFNMVRGTSPNSANYFLWYYYLPVSSVGTFNAPWESPRLFFKQTSNYINNLSKFVITFDYEVYSTSSSGWSQTSFSTQNNIDTQLEFQLLIKTRKSTDATIYHTATYDFTQVLGDRLASGTLPYYRQEIFLPNASPVSTTEEFNMVDLELIHKPSFNPLPSGGSFHFNGQHRIRLYNVDVMEYSGITTSAPDAWLSYGVEDTEDFFTTPIQTGDWQKLALEIDLPNKSINYHVGSVAKNIPIPDVINIPGPAFANEDPTITSHPSTLIFANINDPGLIRDNDIIVIGNDLSTGDGELNYSHFIWNHFQNPSDAYMTQSQRDKLDTLINYNFYYESIEVERYIKIKEAFIDVLDARKLLMNGGFTFREMEPTEQGSLLRSEDQSTTNVNIANTFVSIDKLYNPTPTTTGFLNYNHTTKVFSIAPISISQAEINTGINNIIKTTPSTYGLVFDQTDPNDKYLRIDDNFVNTLINLVVQNENNITAGMIDAVFSDTNIILKDASIYSPFTLRELDDTDVKYNYVINGNHQYLYREVNTKAQYHPTLGAAFGDQNPIVSYDFIGQIINNAPDSYGYTANSFDLIKITSAGQIVYGSSSVNKKGQPGITGGTTLLISSSAFIFSDSYSGCFSFFHRPDTSNTASDNHRIIEVQDGSGVNILHFDLEYISNVATYKMTITDQTNSANQVTTTFNNSDNEIYFGNDNSIVLFYDFPHYHWYINGRFHGSVINPAFTAIQPINLVRLKFDLNVYNNKCCIYEVKVYPRIIFKDGTTTSELDFNYRRAGEVSEMYRIETLLTGGFIIKEASGIAQTKTRAISNTRRVTVLETSSGGGGAQTTTNTGNIATNTTAIATNTGNIATNTTAIATNTGNIATNTTDIATNTGNIATNTTDIATNTGNIATNTTDIATNAGNIATNTTDIATNATAIANLNLYTDADVRSVLSQSAGTNLSWNSANNEIDVNTNLALGSGFSYNDANGTLSVNNFSGNGSSITSLTAGNITSGTLQVTRGGTGKTSYSVSGGLLIGNTYSIAQHTDLTYDASSSTLNVNTLKFADNTQLTSSAFLTDISTNTTNIATNTTNIATNTTNIATNTGDVNTILNNLSFANANYIKVNNQLRIVDNKELKLGTADNFGFENKYNSTNSKLEFSCKNGTGAIFVSKIIVKGVSGSTTQNADWRCFEFLGLNDGTNNYANGDRRSIINVTANVSVNQYPASPAVSFQNWVDGNNLNYLSDGVSNSYYLTAQSVSSSTHFTFDFTGTTKPNVTSLTAFRIYFDRLDWANGTNGNQGTWDLVIEDQNGTQHTIKSNMLIQESSGTNTSSQNYIQFTGFSFPPLQPAVTDIYDISIANGKINIKEELILSADGIKFSDNTTLTTAPQGFSGNYNDLTNLPTLFNGAYSSLTGTPALFSGSYTDLTNKPTIQTLLTDNGDDIDDVACIYFTDPLAFIKGDKLTLRGITTTGGTGTTTETETFATATGGFDAVMTGFNTNLFTNGSIGSANAIPSSTDGTGQFDGYNGNVYSEIRSSGTGTGGSANFNSFTSTGMQKYFVTKGDAPRHLRTKDISSILATCTNLSFKYCVGTNSNGGNRPESSENFYIEFLNQYGNPISSVTIWLGQNLWGNGTNFITFSHNLTTQQKGCYYVRWYQNATSTGNYDHYAVTNIVFTYTGTTSSTTTDIDVRLENLPTSAPTGSNRLYKDSSGYLRIT